MDAGDVEVGHDVTVDRDVLAHLEALSVGQLLAVELPGDLGRWVTAGSALEEDAWSRLKGVFVKGRPDLRWFNCKEFFN